MNRVLQILILVLLCTVPVSAQRKKAGAKKPAAPKLTEQQLRAKQLFDEMLPNTQRVFVIDSIVVGRDSVLALMPLPKVYGSIAPYNQFFGTDDQPDASVYVDGFGNRCFYSKADEDGRMRLYMRERLGQNWSEPQQLEGLGEDLTEMNYPFMAADGTTLYFAAKSESSLGGYDIYVSSYDAEDGSFMKAENIGLPFNSTADDYLYVVDENDSIGWFATSRCQEEGRMCVYTFVPSATRQNYDEDEMDDAHFNDLANLTRIRSTWPTPEIREEAVRRAEKLKAEQRKSSKGQAFRFVVNDEMVYESPSDFSSAANRKAFETLALKKQAIADCEKELDEMRANYRKGNAVARRRLANDIRREENRLENLLTEAAEQEKSLRNKENEASR